MSWAASLCALYDANAWRAGNVENWNGKPVVLMPLGYDTMKAQIEVIIDGDGNFISARTLDKSEAETIVPYPDRRTSGVKALPLCDSLSYIAGDFLERITMFLDGETEKKKARTIHDIKNSFPSYINGLSEWCSSDFVTTKVMAVYKYVLRKSVIADLQKSGVLLPDDDGLLSDRKKILGVRIEKAFVRFRVYEKNVHQEETAIWLDKETQQCFIKYYLSTAKNKDLCYFTGNIELTAKTNPVKIRGEWDTKASLISSNDDSNFTYRGRFKTKDKNNGYNEALSVGYETSQKIHNALKWIIRRQGFIRDGVCLVTWESDLKELPQFYESAVGLLTALSTKDESLWDSEDVLFGESEADHSDTNYATARDLNLAIDGYAKNIEDTSHMVILALDSASPGRLAITYYRELETSAYLKNIRQWQESCCWRQEYFDKDKKYRRYEGIDSIKEIAKAVYGTEKEKLLTLPSNSDGKCPLLISAFDRLRPCIIDGEPIPPDIVRTAVMKASNPLAYEREFNYLRVLHTACSLIKKYYLEKGVIFNMVLDELCTDRSYLFGRLLAVAEKIERCTFDKGETRTTNAERYMRQFSQTPFRTWKIIRRNTQTYLNRLKPGSREYYKDLYGKIEGQFEPGCFEAKNALDGKFLLGYDCQREVLKFRKKDNVIVSDEEEITTISEEEE